MEIGGRGSVVTVARVRRWMPPGGRGNRTPYNRPRSIRGRNTPDETTSVKAVRLTSDIESTQRAAEPMGVRLMTRKGTGMMWARKLVRRLLPMTRCSRRQPRVGSLVCCIVNVTAVVAILGFAVQHAEASDRLSADALIHAGPIGSLEIEAYRGALDGYPVAGLARVTIHRAAGSQTRWRRPRNWSGSLPALVEARSFSLGSEDLAASLDVLGWSRTEWSELRRPDAEANPRSLLAYRVDSTGSLKLTQSFWISKTETANVAKSGPPRELLVALDRSGRIVSVETTGLYATVDGQVRGFIPAAAGPYSSSATFVAAPLSQLTVNAIGYTPQFTDSDGYFSFDVPPSAAVVVNRSLSGPLFSIQNQAGPSASYLLFLTEGTGLTQIDFNETPSEESTAEVSAYSAATAGYDFIQRIAPGFGPAQAPVNINVNLDGECFAFYSGFLQSLNFSTSGGGCVNTAYGSIVAHEYYHHLQSGLPVASDPYREAMADVFAAYTFESPTIGPDYFGPATHVRDLDTSILFPVASTDPAEEGLPLAAAFWNLRLALIATEGNIAGATIAGELWLASQMISSGFVDNSVVEDLLFVDDDDGDLSNGTPHFGEIVGAFAAHGFTAPVPPIENFHCTPQETRVRLSWNPPEGVLFDSFQILRNGTLIGLAPGSATTYDDLFAPAGALDYELVPALDATVDDSVYCSTTLPAYSAFVRGDANGDGGLLLNDPVAILDYLFITATPLTSCLDAMDSDDNGEVQIGDAVILLQFLFASGSPPSAPFPLFGFDPTPDEIACP